MCVDVCVIVSDLPQVGGIYCVDVCVIVSDLPHVGGIYSVDVCVIVSDLPHHQHYKYHRNVVSH
jgi:hypothetical protein